MIKQNRPNQGVLAFCGALVIAAIWMLFFRGGGLESAARVAAQALKERNGKQLLQFADPSEIACSGLTEQNLQALLDHVYGGPLSRFKLTDERATKSQNSADYELRYTDSAEHDIGISMIVSKSGDGSPKASVLWTILALSWAVDDHGVGIPSPTVDDYIRGFHRDRAFLESIGLKGIAMNPLSCRSWDKFDQFLAKASENDHKYRR